MQGLLELMSDQQPLVCDGALVEETGRAMKECECAFNAAQRVIDEEGWRRERKH